MTEKELGENEVSLDQAADRFEAIAAELREEGDFDIDIDNRTVHLSTPSVIAVEIGVRESSSMLRGDRETLTVKMDWQPE